MRILRKKFLLCKAFVKKEFILVSRYLFNSIGGFITLYIVFLLMFSGYKGLAGNSPNFGDMVEGLVVGYTLWILAMSVYQDVTYSVLREAREGTLEQLYMSVNGFGWVMGMKVFASILFNIVFVGVVLLLLIFTTGRSFNIDIISLFLPVSFVLLSVLGIGFIIGGLTLIYKRIDNYLQIITFGLIGLIAAPVGRIPSLKFLPASFGSSMVKDIMTEGKSILDFSTNDILFVAFIGFLYLFIGYGVYKKCESLAMSKGMLGHY